MKNNISLKSFLQALPILIIVFLFSSGVNGQVSVKELQTDIKYLASDSLKGRLTG